MTREFLRRHFLQALSLAAATLPVMISALGWFRLLNENAGEVADAPRAYPRFRLTHACGSPAA